MFENKKTILFITKSKIKIARVTMGGRPREDIVVVVDWTSNTLPDILFKYKKEIKGSARILLGEDFVYTVNVTMPSGSYLRDDVKKKAQELIPEELDQTIWDFKDMGSPTPQSGPLPIIQVIAIAKTLFETLRKAVAKVELQIEAIEPLSFALARFAKEEDGIVVYVYRDDGVLVTLAQKGDVIATENLENIDLDQLNEFLTFSERFSGRVENVIFCGNTSGIDLTGLENANFKAQVLNISPIISLAYKEDLKGKDEQVLNLLFPESLPHPNPLPKGEGGEQTSVTNKVTKQKISKTTIFAVSLLIAIGILVALIIFKVYL